MNLTDAQVKDFQRLYKESFDLDIGKDEAYKKGLQLVELMKNIYKPITEEGREKYSN